MKIEIDTTYHNLIKVEMANEKISANDVDYLIGQIDKVHQKYNNVNLIILFGGHTKASLKSLYESLKLVKHGKGSISKIAVIGHSNFIKMGVKLDDMFFPWQENYFDDEDLATAWKWITEIN